MNLPAGKIAVIWQLGNCARGDLKATIKEIKRLGCTAVAPKVANGFVRWTGLKPLVDACHAEGWPVLGWHYLYSGVYYTQADQWVTTSVTPELEATVSADQVEALGLDAFVIDAEREYKVCKPADRAKRYMRVLKARLSCPIGLSSYRFPTMHAEFPWREFLAGCDFHMPQVYWNPPSAANHWGPTPELERSVQELKALKDIPIYPLGRAYIGDGHPDPKPTELTTFLGKACELDLPGAGFWALDFLYLHAGGRERAAAIAGYPWDEQPPIIPEPPLTWAGQITKWARSQPDPYTGPEPD